MRIFYNMRARRSCVRKLTERHRLGCACAPAARIVNARKSLWHHEWLRLSEMSACVVRRRIFRIFYG